MGAKKFHKRHRKGEKAIRLYYFHRVRASKSMIARSAFKRLKKEREGGAAEGEGEDGEGLTTEASIFM